jgi:baculoviral IAP repeat-containing protein 7/8
MDVCGNMTVPEEGEIKKNLPYSSYEDRLNSFECWPTQMNPQKEELAKAGFYYLQIGDKVQCFYCNLGLKDWGKDDNAFEEHKKWSVKCLFLDTVEWEKGKTVTFKATPFTDAIDTDVTKEPLLETLLKPLSLRRKSCNDQNLQEDNLTVDTCKVCFLKKVSQVIIPCGHVLCGDCIFQVKKCPMCNGDFTKINKLFLS